MSTRKEKVLDYLGDNKWHDGYELIGPSVGGTDGLRRLRELRSDGHQIEKRLKPGRPKGSTVHQYKLVRTKEERTGTPSLRGCTCIWNHTDSFQVVEYSDRDCPVEHPRIMRKSSDV